MFIARRSIDNPPFLQENLECPPRPPTLNFFFDFSKNLNLPINKERGEGVQTMSNFNYILCKVNSFLWIKSTSTTLYFHVSLPVYFLFFPSIVNYVYKLWISYYDQAILEVYIFYFFVFWCVFHDCVGLILWVFKLSVFS